MTSAPEAKLAERGLCSSYRWRRLAFEIGELDDARGVPAGGDKAQQIGGRHRGRAIVDQRVVVERVVIEPRGLEHPAERRPDIAADSEGGGRPRQHAPERSG